MQSQRILLNVRIGIQRKQQTRNPVALSVISVHFLLHGFKGDNVLLQLLLNCGTNVDDKGRKDNCTALMEAASNGNLQIVELLHKSGADVNARSSAGE